METILMLFLALNFDCAMALEKASEAESRHLRKIGICLREDSIEKVSLCLRAFKINPKTLKEMK